MIRTIVSVNDHSVSVTAFRDGEMGMRTISVQRQMVPSDAFDYAHQALGYFRFAIAEMDCARIEIEVANTSGCIELIEITRD